VRLEVDPRTGPVLAGGAAGGGLRCYGTQILDLTLGVHPDEGDVSGLAQLGKCDNEQARAQHHKAGCD
jgi:hypothetical protein